MRINQLASHYQTARLQSFQSGNAQTNRNLASAQQTNQGRLTDAAKGFVQATKIRDGVAATGDGLAQARALVKKAQDPALSAGERKQLQADFTKALAAVDKGTRDEAKAISSPVVANSTYAAKRVGTESADQLGRKASDQFASVADLAKLDLTTASADQLAGAAKVLDAAKTQTDARLADTTRQVDRITGRINKLETVQSALDSTSARPSQQQSNVERFAALLQQQRTQVQPGDLFSTII